MKQATDNTLVSVIDAEEEVTFRSYVHIPSGTISLKFSIDCNQEIKMSQRDNLEHLLSAMATVVAPTMLTFNWNQVRTQISTALKGS